MVEIFVGSYVKEIVFEDKRESEVEGKGATRRHNRIKEERAARIAAQK